MVGVLGTWDGRPKRRVPIRRPSLAQIVFLLFVFQQTGRLISKSSRYVEILKQVNAVKIVFGAACFYD